MLRGECDMVHVERKPVSDLQRGDQWARRRAYTRPGWVDGRHDGAERATQARLSPRACSSSARGHAAARLEHNPHDSAPTRITRLVGRLGAMLGAGRT